MSPHLADWLDEIISVTLLFLIVYVADLICRFIVNKVVGHIAKMTKSRWDDIFLEYKVFRYLTHAIPGLIFFLCTPIAIKSVIWVKLFQKAALIYITVVIIRAIVAATNAMTRIYAESESYAKKPVKIIFQIVAVMVFIGGISILSIIINASLATLFADSGLSWLSSCLFSRTVFSGLWPDGNFPQMTCCASETGLLLQNTEQMEL
jgi:miniconductance mechanosensitive channel